MNDMSTESTTKTLPPKTRFAPSPTGFMHFGNARTALFNFLYAEHLGGTCLLRIEDTDKIRSEERYVEEIQRDLAWMGISWEAGEGAEGADLHRQSQRSAIYNRYYDQLQQAGRAYDCFCTEQELAISRKTQLSSGKPPRYTGTCRHLTPEQKAAKQHEAKQRGVEPALRFAVESGKSVTFNDVVKGPQKFMSDDIGDFIIRRGDGSAAFFFCNAIDDSLMGVTHALRGDDHLTNTPRQLMLLEALGLRMPEYGHFPTILGQDGSPLSKRNGSRSIMELREQGYHPQGILNYMARLGHYYSINELLDIVGLGKHFDLEHISHSPAHFDEVQLHFWQKEAMHKSAAADFLSFIKPFIRDKVPEVRQALFAEVIQPNITMPKEAEDWIECLLSEKMPFEGEVQAAIQGAGAEFVKTGIALLEKQPETDYKTWVQDLQTETGLKGKALFLPLRAIMTRQLSGPELARVFVLLGVAGVKTRFEQAGAFFGEIASDRS